MHITIKKGIYSIIQLFIFEERQIQLNVFKACSLFSLTTTIFTTKNVRLQGSVEKLVTNHHSQVIPQVSNKKWGDNVC